MFCRSWFITAAFKWSSSFKYSRVLSVKRLCYFRFSVTSLNNVRNRSEPSTHPAEDLP